jgi:hypothetical protein
MAKKKAAKKMQAVQEERALKPIRLGLPPADYERLERCARERGLSLASYARQAVLAAIKADEAEG